MKIIPSPCTTWIVEGNPDIEIIKNGNLFYVTRDIKCWCTNICACPSYYVLEKNYDDTFFWTFKSHAADSFASLEAVADALSKVKSGF